MKAYIHGGAESGIAIYIKIFVDFFRLRGYNHSDGEILYPETSCNILQKINLNRNKVSSFRHIKEVRIWPMAAGGRTDAHLRSAARIFYCVQAKTASAQRGIGQSLC